MNKIIIKRQKKDKNYRILEFKYVAKGVNEIDEELSKKIDKFLNNKNHSDMIKNVQVLRTILKDYEEIELEITYKDNKKYEIVNYNKGKLTLYEIVDIKRNFDFIDHYHRGIIFKSSNKDRKKSKEIYNEMLDYVTKLQNVEGLKLSLNQEELIEIYKLFYAKTPDFNDQDINIKIQTMMVILASYGINLDSEYSFNCIGENKIPLSFYLQSIIQELALYGDLSYIDTSIKLSKEATNIIKTVGEVIREQLVDNKITNIKKLIDISKIVYANRYEMPINDDNKEIIEISKYSGCSKEQIETTIGISRKINKKLYN